MVDEFKKYNSSAGFTLLELLVVIVIIIIITIVALLNYRGIQEEFTLRREAQNLTSALIETQVFAMAVKEFPSGSAKFPAHGINFNIITNDDKYTFFGDKYTSLADDGDKIYTDSANEKIKEYLFKNSIKIQELCGDEISNPPGDCSISSLDIVFLRPDPIIYLTGNSPPKDFDDIRIELQSPNNKTKSVIFKKIGEIYVQ
ncbi:MAG: hypothetical protein A3A94_01635 [Candidatus Portnoybacteria bacterium RIFCSPLOWO2_01_FULL_43_11]|uniref:Type II secretion system protein GspH n=4 Tax=Candidatus Portnoyibacteriota TaxID=1817913 RepID=A0A1G2FDZ3_9BACT|nr:MAG: hypothetical protein A2815_00380 [Candidatus Portnoybacteria bacterium RIFCSPHIGHO2_01_FULL_40_12b]OGZ37799.1 MAG: hypothetical protein A3E90_02155 [Candidatus Portnoybacteria bacterium RIFCSPHIGHO2_12_FULL_40_11]OGZ39167.1 MAG: hypothetical protein A3A94_01635 [Candidatus Portnoybacteria bacterium RIFCSPLOWO2_01_FULL_43_11]OGZ39897.1 MAG: hypothetical protein A3I20_02790 [Candidatus Portnoybacteria bacterium RIFCSPLOWO2_02_FULL_40_15]